MLIAGSTVVLVAVITDAGRRQKVCRYRSRRNSCTQLIQGSCLTLLFAAAFGCISVNINRLDTFVVLEVYRLAVKYYAPPVIGGSIKRCFCLMSVCRVHWA